MFRIAKGDQKGMWFSDGELRSTKNVAAAVIFGTIVNACGDVVAKAVFGK
jgi:hypothetical protein